MLFQEDYDELRREPSKTNQFLKAIEEKPVLSCHEQKWPTYVPCDELVVAIATQSNVATSSINSFATVELHGEFTRGMMVIDWRGHLKRDNNVRIVTELDKPMYKQMLLDTFK